MKLISWNVNGIRAILKKNFMDFFEKADFDVLCLQETKIHDGDVTEVMKSIGQEKGYTSYWHGAQKKGYSSTAIFTNTAPLSYTTGIGDERFDSEGRVQIMEFENFFLINIYVPNAKDDLSRLAERQEHDKLFLKKIAELEQKKPVVICGDLNVAHKEIDLARPKQNERSAGFTKEERAGMDAYVNHGLIDSFRHIHGDVIDRYSWWSYRGGARDRNVGWRIDYFLVSQVLKPSIIDAEIYDSVLGSDHCPVYIELKD